MIRLSFCITCKGRLHHLRQTLPRNLEWTAHLEGIEFVLLNYTSPDGLDDWVRSEMAEPIGAGRLNYYCAHGFTHFQRAHAKNVAHRAAGGAIVCNLDADNFLGAGFAEFLLTEFGQRERSFIRAPAGRSTFGKIAFTKSDFIALGGYDERMAYGWGWEDEDILSRAVASGLREVIIPRDRNWLCALPHSHTARTQFSERKNRLDSNNEHKRLSLEAIESGSWIANAGRNWGAARLTHNFAREVDSANFANNTSVNTPA